MDATDYNQIVCQLESWVKALEKAGEADKVYYRSNNQSLSPRRILQEVRDRTEFGRSYFDSWMEIKNEKVK